MIRPRQTQVISRQSHGSYLNTTSVNLLITIMVALIAAASTANAQNWFGPPTSYPVGTYPASVVSADFNRDGHEDIAVGYSVFDSISVFFGDGNGGLVVPAHNYWVGVTGYSETNGAAHLITADFNGDGYSDLVKAHNTVCDSISVLLNNGDGSFRWGGNYRTGVGPSNLCSVDIDGDGDLDLVVANAGSYSGGYSDGSFDVFRNDGSGLFQLVAEYPDDSPEDPFAVTPGDFDGDSDNDLAVAYAKSNQVLIWLNQGDGTFTRLDPPLSVPNYPKGLCSGDFNHDGHLDLVVAQSWAPYVSVFYGEGDGTFTNGGDYYTVSSPYPVIAVDFDRDGFLDLATANNGSNTISVFRNLSGSGFSDATVFETGQLPHSLCASDFNEDGFLDIATGNNASNTISILQNSNSFCNNSTIGGIAYLWKNSGVWELWRTRPDGTGKSKIITVGGSAAGGTRISSDGNEIAFGSDTSGAYEIYVVKADGTDLRRVTTGGCLGVLDWINTTQLLYLTSDWRIARINVDGTGNEILSPADGYDYAEATISPDGAEIAYGKNFPGFTTNRKVYVADYPSFLHARVVADINGDAGTDAVQDWSCSNRLVFLYEDSGTDNLYMVRPNGTYLTNLSTVPSVRDPRARFSPDASSLAFISNQSGTYNLWVMNADGSNRSQLTFGSFDGEIGDFDWGMLSAPAPTSAAAIWIDSTTVADGFVQVMMRNGFDVAAFTIPLLHDSAAPIDSVSNVDCRTANWQSFYGTSYSDSTLLIGGIASIGGGIPCMPVGEGPVARIYFPRACFDTFAVAFDTTYISEPGKLLVVDCSASSYTPSFTAGAGTYETFLCGDINADCGRNIADVVYLINYIFSYGVAPMPANAGDVDGDCTITIADAVYYINWIFMVGGAEPVCGCINSGLFAKPYSGAADVNYSTVSGSETTSLTLATNCDRAIRGVQLEFNIVGDANVVDVTSKIAGLQEFHSTVDGVLKVGLLDVTGKTVIPAGQHDFVTITYASTPSEAGRAASSGRTGDEIKLVSAIVVGEDASKMNVTIKSVGAGSPNGALPSVFALSQNIPNPFNPTTEIGYALPKASSVRLEVLNVLGQVVRTLVDEFQTAGNHSTVWDGRDNSHQEVSSGVYFYRIAAGEYAETKKMVLMK